MKFLCVLPLFIAAAYGAACPDAHVEAKGFTTTDATIVSRVAYVVDFELKCGSGETLKDATLYADTPAGIVAVASANFGSGYQVSWSAEPASAPSGEQLITLYDEQGYSALKKSQRGEGAAPTPLAAASLHHPGAYRGPWVASETVALWAAAATFYYAFSVKSSITQ